MGLSQNDEIIAARQPPEFTTFFRQELVSDIKPEEDNVPIPDDILLALGADQALLSGRSHGARLHQVVVGNDLCPDKAPLKIGVDFPGGLRSLCALGDGPRPALVLTAGQVGDQPRISRSRPLSVTPRSSRNMAFSSPSSCAISASSFAQTGITCAPSAWARASTCR